MAVNPDRHLWLSVIDQAFMDASSAGIGREGSSSATVSWSQKMAAHEWLMEDSIDNKFVCMMAGVSPREVREAYLALIKSEMTYMQWKKKNAVGGIVFDSCRGKRVKR